MLKRSGRIFILKALTVFVGAQAAFMKYMKLKNQFDDMIQSTNDKNVKSDEESKAENKNLQ